MQKLLSTTKKGDKLHCNSEMLGGYQLIPT